MGDKKPGTHRERIQGNVVSHQRKMRKTAELSIDTEIVRSLWVIGCPSKRGQFTSNEMVRAKIKATRPQSLSARTVSDALSFF
jgi:hypothetical protein